MKNNNTAFRYFDFTLRLLVLFHFLNIASWKYYTHNPEVFFKLPVLDIFSNTPIFFHVGIFLLFTCSAFLFIFKKNNFIYSFLLSLCFIYFELHDKFSFHQDIFLAINIYFLYGLAKYHYQKNNDTALRDYIFALKVLCTLVYLFAGLHKINPYFYSGNLIEDILSTGILSKVPFLSEEFIPTISQPLAIFTIVGEFSIPILLWTRYRKLAVFIAFSLHFGISFFSGRGILFNLYLPALSILFFTFKTVNISTLSTRIKTILQKIDIINLIESNSPKNSKKSSWYSLFNQILLINPLFIIYMGLFFFHSFGYVKRIILVNIMGFESTSIMQLFQ